MKNTGPLEANGKWDRIFLGIMALGVVLFVVALMVDSQRAWYNYLIVFFFFLTLSMGGMVFVGVQYAASAAWSVTVRRIAEGLFSWLPVAFILLVGLFIGIPKLYEWYGPAPADFFTYTKEVYLTSLWFIVRQLFFFGLWALLGFLIVRNSLKQDQTGNAGLTLANKKLSIIFLIVFGYSFTFSSMDLLMSLEEHFYSTMFGVYCFAGAFLSGMSLVAIITILLKRNGYLKGAVEHKHLHDLGTWIMAFSVFMVYIGFAQYMLIWYANLPHEIIYLVPRSVKGWQYLFILLPILKWLVPFIVLMPEKFRANPKVLMGVSILVLVGQYLDIYWMVVPSFSESFRMIGWIEIGVFLVFAGLFGLVLRRFYLRYSLIPVADPSLETCVKGRYQHV